MQRPIRLRGTIATTLLILGVSSLGLAQAPPPPPPPPPPLGQPFPTLTPAELGRWQAGRADFTSPVSPQGGLGPVFNENACNACHNGGGVPGASGPRLVTRFGLLLNGQFNPLTAFGGPTLQDKGIGRFNGINFVGEVVPIQANVATKRRTTALFGLGLVDAIPDANLIELSQFQETAYPATAGRPNFILDPASSQTRVGRFGWKAQEATLFSFSADALLNEMGVTTPVFPVENCPGGNCALLVGNPAWTFPNSVNYGLIQQLTDFMTFNAPAPPAPPTPDSRAGANLFANLGCYACHQPNQQAGPSPSPTLNMANFFPYSDFLLHNMGSLGDGMVQGQAQPTEFRTAPLWGLRFQAAYLHDGRAPTPTAAILAHDGQGKGASLGFAALTATQKAQLLAFLNTL